MSQVPQTLNRNSAYTHYSHNVLFRHGLPPRASQNRPYVLIASHGHPPRHLRRAKCQSCAIRIAWTLPWFVGTWTSYRQGDHDELFGPRLVVHCPIFHPIAHSHSTSNAHTKEQALDSHASPPERYARSVTQQVPKVFRRDFPGTQQQYNSRGDGTQALSNTAIVKGQYVNYWRRALYGSAPRR